MKYTSKLNQMKDFFKEMNLIIVTDKEGKVLYYNDFGDRYNMIGDKNPLGKSIFDLYPWLTKENSTIFKVIKTGEPIVNETQIVRIDENNQVRAINSAFPLKNEEGILGAIEISIDLDYKKDPGECGDEEAAQNKGLLKSLNAKYTFDDFLTRDQELQKNIAKLKNSVNSSSNIFIYGETGTGKELIAHAVHNASRHANRPFITQNCAAIPASLMESVLFGTMKGSYTGARERQGIFEIAEGGTIFLDEINSMPYEMQAKLLRVVENKAIRRIGGKEEIEVDVQIISSTNEDPDKMLKNRSFREDLFFRLNVITLRIPPLRERKCDIPLLTQNFIQQYNNLFQKNITSVDNEVMNLFHNYSWPGNVRELKNCLEGAFSACNSRKITVQDLPEYYLSSLQDSDGHQNGLEEKVDLYEKKLIEEKLAASNHNVAETARQLEVPRSTLYYKMDKHGIEAEK